jgi:hypothetical protein
MIFDSDGGAWIARDGCNEVPAEANGPLGYLCQVCGRVVYVHEPGSIAFGSPPPSYDPAAPCPETRDAWVDPELPPIPVPEPAVEAILICGALFLAAVKRWGR